MLAEKNACFKEFRGLKITCVLQIECVSLPFFERMLKSSQLVADTASLWPTTATAGRVGPICAPRLRPTVCGGRPVYSLPSDRSQNFAGGGGTGVVRCMSTYQ